MKAFSQVMRAYGRRRFTFLFYTLLLTVGLEPILAPLFPRLDILLGFLTLNVIAAVVGTLPRLYARPAILAGTLFIGVRFLRSSLGESVVLASEAAWALACAPAVAVAVRHSLRPGRVDSERVFAALDAYLIAGIIFGLGYAGVERTWPGSFSQSVPGELTLPRAIYFSFVTLVTLGYGDIVPASDALRGVVVLEALGGHLYVVVLVARLVSLYTLSHGAAPDD